MRRPAFRPAHLEKSYLEQTKTDFHEQNLNKCAMKFFKKIEFVESFKHFENMTLNPNIFFYITIARISFSPSLFFYSLKILFKLSYQNVTGTTDNIDITTLSWYSLFLVAILLKQICLYGFRSNWWCGRLFTTIKSFYFIASVVVLLGLANCSTIRLRTWEITFTF